MTTSAVIRPLAPSEAMFAGVGVYVGYAVEVSGRLDLTALTTAYEALVRAYPVLGARLERSDEDFVLVPAPGAAPEISVVDGDPDRLLHDQKFDQRTRLSEVSVVRDGERASVALFTHHSIADAYHSLAVLAELWSCYTDVVAGRSPERDVRPYPMSIEEALAARGIEKMPLPVPEQSPVDEATQPPVDEATAIDAAAPAAEVPAGENDWRTPPLTSRCHLSVAETTALVELGHRAGVTINGLVSAAIMLSEAEIRELSLTELLYIYPVDLRTRLTPTIGKTDGTNLLGFANYTPTAASIELVGLARDVCDALSAAIADGVVQQTPLHIPDMTATVTAPIPGMMVVTNWGRVPELRTPEGLRITDFRSTITANPEPDLARPPQQPGSGACILSTFGGRLSIEIHHTESGAAQEQRRVDRYRDRLRDAIS